MSFAFTSRKRHSTSKTCEKYPAIFLLIIALELRAQTAATQINIKGIVVDSANNKPLSYATMVLREAITDAPLNLHKSRVFFEWFPIPKM